MAAAPQVADIVDSPGGADYAGSVEGRLWDEAAENPARVDTVNFISAPLHRQPLQQLIVELRTRATAARP